MLFNSFAFLVFFAAVATLYYWLPQRWRWLLLLLASYYFYSAFDPRYVALLAFDTAIAYTVARLLVTSSRRRLWLAGGIAAELAVLGVFKYLDFFAGAIEPVLGDIALPRLGILLPVGLSFYTFSCISYLIDVHRGTIPPERHAGRLAVYVAFFPKLLAGPIERAGPFLAQLARPVAFDHARIAFGLQLMLWGLFKKVVIADRLATYVDAAFQSPAFQSPVTLLVGVYFYAFQIYCDFSGYSDIAIGAAAVLGFSLMENFRRPYLARSVPEFWNRRWHLSLMAWFRDYLYIPLGGNRVGRLRWYGNQMAVYLASGLWHGANWTFVAWGGLNGIYQVAYYALAGVRRRLGRLLPLPPWLAGALAILLTFHLIAVAWVFFRAASIGDAVTVLERIAGALPQLPALLASYGWTGGIVLSAGLIVLLLAIEVLDEIRPVQARLAEQPRALRWAVHYAVMAALAVMGVWSLNQFVYMQF